LQASVRAVSLTGFVEVSRQVGLDPHAALRRAGIDWRALGNPELRLPARAVYDLLEDAAARSGCPTFGLRMGELRRLSDFGAVGLLIVHQPTVRAALATATAYSHMINPSVLVDYQQTGELVIVREHLVADAGPQGCDLAVAVLLGAFRSVLGSGWRPVSVNLTHPAADVALYRRVFGEAIEFDSEFNGLVLMAADVDQANPSADPAFARYARQLVDALPDAVRDDPAEQTRKRLYHLLPLGRATLAAVADSIGFTERTLQRRLERQGVRFGQLLDQVRSDLARRHLANPDLSVTRIAQLLGYGQLSSFTRWFTDEFGTSPARWRLGRGAA
jgi:AraC-like DNA-binding protein